MTGDGSWPGFWDLWRSARMGEIPTVPPRVPPHLEDCRWRFVCECGVNWTARASAVIVGGQVRAPARECTTCGRWVESHPILENA